MQDGDESNTIPLLVIEEHHEPYSFWDHGYFNGFVSPFGKLLRPASRFRTANSHVQLQRKLCLRCGYVKSRMVVF